MTSNSPSPAEADTVFDRLKGLSQVDRRPYNLIVDGQDYILLRQHRYRLKQAGDDADKARPASPLAARFIEGARLQKSLGLDGPESRPANAEKPSLVVLPSPTARSLTIVFSGNNREFALPAHLLMKHDTHLVLILDRRRCFALAGIPGLGADYEACVTNLRRIAEALHAEEVFVLGISAGGAGAIKFACDLAAQNLLCFSVPTTLRLEDDEGATLARYPQLARLYRYDRSLGIDLAKYYVAHETHPPASFIYSASHPRDSWLALRMANLPGVQLVATDGYVGHTTYRWLTLQGTIGRYLDTLYTTSPGMLAALAADQAVVQPAEVSDTGDLDTRTSPPSQTPQPDPTSPPDREWASGTSVRAASARPLHALLPWKRKLNA